MNVKQYNIFCVTFEEDNLSVMEMFSTEGLAQNYLAEVRKVHGRHAGFMTRYTVNVAVSARCVEGWECFVFFSDGTLIGPERVARLLEPPYWKVDRRELTGYEVPLSSASRSDWFGALAFASSREDAERLAVEERYKWLKATGRT
jgi:hypothetical protein